MSTSGPEYRSGDSSNQRVLSRRKYFSWVVFRLYDLVISDGYHVFTKEGGRSLHITAEPILLILSKIKNKDKGTNIKELITTAAWASWELDASFCKTSVGGRHSTLLQHVPSSSVLSSNSMRGRSFLRSRRKEQKCNERVMARNNSWGRYRERRRRQRDRWEKEDTKRKGNQKKKRRKQ